MKLYQTEQECGNGKNSWTGAVYSWNLMRHYLENGASAYMYWNISLDKGGISRWGWAQNSLVVVDPDSHTFQYTHEYYVMKHVSHYVQPGAWRLETKGGYANQLSFLNPDQSVVVVLANESPDDLSIAVQVDGRLYRPLVKAHSLATLLIE
jgi:glucosylceramidase